MFRKWLLGLALAAGSATAPAYAGMLGDAVFPEAGGSPLIQEAQLPLPFPVDLFFFGGHDHCWYDDGWHGPGWYWCGYGYRQGYGYAGPEGWHGLTQHRYERDWHGGHGEHMDHMGHGDHGDHMDHGPHGPGGGQHGPGGGGMHPPGGGGMHPPGGGGGGHGGGEHKEH